MNTHEIRKAFLDYFASRDHAVLPGSSLVPAGDPTLLFTNAGMVQFKDIFLGERAAPWPRAATCQRCVRAGGKHNDLENVGYTARHHTFFEMLGNFSFGDYFKREAIRYAWEFLTDRRWLGLPAERLWVTVYADDEEAYRIWREEVGFPAERLVRIGDNKGAPYASDNFWMMGDTGPCGPCTEIFYDHGPEVAGGPPGSAEEEGDRYVEIWNVVFMQYNRDAQGRLSPLPKPSVDTGMGLERVAAVLQGVHSNYEIDLFRALIAAAAEATGAAQADSPSLRVLADHIRAAAFLVMDGVLPANEGRGYVLRRIIRRALRHGHKLGAESPFFHRLVAPLVALMGDAYPDLVRRAGFIEETLLAEERQFARTLSQGLAVLEEALAKSTGEVLPGELVFRLYDTYGFPVDLTADIARERGVALDLEGFEARMAEQRARARAASRFGSDAAFEPAVEGESEFTGYERTRDEGQILALWVDGAPAERLEADQEGVVVLDRTPFYAESGGQVGDAGMLEGPGGRFEVRDCRKRGAVHLHFGRVLSGALAVGERVEARVEPEVRAATARNHSATHLLHAALRRVLGEHVTQQGSLVDSERLRFDFSHPQPLSRQELEAVERLVNAEIRRNTEVRVELLPREEALARGALALFGEKYGETVRVLTMGEGFSVELCGGTHVTRTGDIGFFKITAEGGIAAGVRRIEAVTGEAALAFVHQLEATLDGVAEAVKASPAAVLDRVRQLAEQNRALAREVEALKARLAEAGGGDLLARARQVGSARVLAAAVEGADAKALRTLVDRLKARIGQGVVVLAAPGEEKVSLVVGVTPPLTDAVDAGELVRFVATQLGGRGGGRADLAQGGGVHPEKLPEVLESVYRYVAERLAA
ncbi:MAG: alanine--tRNA ligase [Porticoccaceae bacterium]|nr:MAG: alanine--tRNA ligase [Porticoccaceae bacterium]